MTTTDVLVAETATCEFELLRLVMVDSYTKGKITELPISGGTIITGRNGRGKTSLLQIILAFYGERPDRIVVPASNKVSFARYYLPRMTSYLVYEYQREFFVSQTPELTAMADAVIDLEVCAETSRSNQFLRNSQTSAGE
jgi:predicted ATP-binding protein involved in virulence